MGRLVLAHAGNVKPSDLNRQLLMTTDQLGKSRVECAKRRLLELNPHIEVVAVAENVSPQNAQRLVGQVDLVVDCAPLFAERFAMNSAAIALGRPMVGAAMFSLVAQLTTIVPGQTACLKCISPAAPPDWARRFPVFGAVSGSVACLAAMEAIKLLAGFAPGLTGKMLHYNLETMSFRTLPTIRRPDCPSCGHTPSPE